MAEPTASNPNLKRQERKQLRQQQLKAFVEEPAGNGNILVDPLPSTTVTAEQRAQDMSNKLDDILRCLPPSST
ncbi:hypothetical protein GE09DRAFT_1210706 [Coniochaeta sp. 2T2.1]|nr:hypothetical protein GE09DRAFT_1210706 [Coniochaeta sp. 2T2.1]